jgi:hypothetical protein
MDEKMLHILKKGKDINPGKEFKQQSHAIILTTHQKPATPFSIVRKGITENITFGLSLSLASILLLVIFSGFFWGFPKNNNLAENQEVFAEAENIDFDIHLREATYFSESAEEMAALLDEIKSSE